MKRNFKANETYKYYKRHDMLSEDDDESASEDNNDKDEDGRYDPTYKITMRREIEEGNRTMHSLQDKIEKLEHEKGVLQDELKEAAKTMMDKECEMRDIENEYIRIVNMKDRIFLDEKNQMKKIVEQKNIKTKTTLMESKKREKIQQDEMSTANENIEKLLLSNSVYVCCAYLLEEYKTSRKLIDVLFASKNESMEDYEMKNENHPLLDRAKKGIIVKLEHHEDNLWDDIESHDVNLNKIKWHVKKELKDIQTTKTMIMEAKNF